MLFTEPPAQPPNVAIAPLSSESIVVTLNSNPTPTSEDEESAKDIVTKFKGKLQ